MEVKLLIRFLRIIIYTNHQDQFQLQEQKKQQQQPQPRPIPAPPRTKIMEKSKKALKGYTKSYEIAIKNDKDVLEQLQNTRLVTSPFFEKILNQTKGFKFVETIVVNFEKLKNGEPEEQMTYFNSKALIIMNVKPSLEMSQGKIMNDVAEWLKRKRFDY